MKKATAFLLLISLLILAGNLYAKKKEAELEIVKKNGQKMRGELIAVKKDSLLLLSSEGVDISSDIKDIREVSLVKKYKLWRGPILGYLVTGASLMIIWYATDPEGASDPEGGGPLVAGLILGIPGIFLGLIVEGFWSSDKTYQIEGRSDSEIMAVLDELHKKARVTNFQ
jgi:hypothetical protein